MLRQRAGKQLRCNVNNWYYALVRHACRTNHADRANDATADFIWCCYDAAFIQGYQSGIAANENLHTVRLAADIEKLENPPLPASTSGQISRAFTDRWVV